MGENGRYQTFPPPRYTTVTAFTRAATEANLPDSSIRVISEPVALSREVRCFVAHHSVVTHGWYLNDGNVWNREDYTPAEHTRMRHAVQAANRPLTRLGADQPAGWALDMGQLPNRCWVPVEANPAWSPGIYGCEPAGVVTAIIAAWTNPNPQWRWIPDPWLETNAHTSRPLTRHNPTWEPNSREPR